MLDLTYIPDFLEPSKKEKFMRIFSEYVNIHKNHVRNCYFVLRGKFC